jgi:hypothetical protein
MNRQDNEWKEAREYSFRILEALIDASTDTESLQSLEQDINALNEKYSSNIYLQGMFYTFEDILIFRIGEDKERDERLYELFTHISDLVHDNDESLLPPIEIFDPIKDGGNINDFKVSEDLSTIENKTENQNTNEGESTMKTNTNNQTKQEQETVRTERVKVVEKSTWCKVIGGLTVTAAIGAGAYYAYKKFFKNEEA